MPFSLNIVPNVFYMCKEITLESFDAEVINSKSLTLVKFKTEWSGACQILEPVYKDVSKHYKTVNFFTVDVEKQPGLQNKYGVIEIPTVVLFMNGGIIDHAAGLFSRNMLIAKIENALSFKSI